MSANIAATSSLDQDKLGKTNSLNEEPKDAGDGEWQQVHHGKKRDQQGQPLNLQSERDDQGVYSGQFTDTNVDLPGDASTQARALNADRNFDKRAPDTTN